MSRILTSVIVSVLFIFMSTGAVASTTMQASDLEKVEKKQIQSASERETMEQVAVTLASYEFAAAKLVDLVNENRMRDSIDRQAGELISLSESVLDWGRFRLAQCDAYLATSLELKDQLQSISHDALEKNYHHDGLLPQAPPECYHIKDLFVHPATVLVLTRDDPGLNAETRENIKAEITEVLAHTEIVRQLVLY
jgi:hypothetical protein